MNTTVLIPAAGMGRRMGAGLNKQYLQLAGRSILARTLELFQRHPAIHHIYPIIPADEIAFFTEKILPDLNLNKLAKIIAGGKERQDSVRNGLQQLQLDQIPQDAVVLIHDGVRPLLNPALIPLLIDTAVLKDGAVVGVPVKDTIKEVEQELILGTPERSRLWQVQTPQAFRFAILWQAYQKAAEDNFCGTDDASLVERLGLKVAMLEGDYRNLKITTPEDLLIAEALLKTGRDH
ncbi:MAG: 2-C-methyl-D-erythritol 4-phosphate cytidylyltransferase [Geopsychrobacter sp.]|nr:2-C-methyl-D-erythritol 4-phosphate cytidylyltransferase [Geopsychrobacter sp.]